MAEVIYTEDRDTFEAQFFRPPFLARMLERTAPYIDGLNDKDAFLEVAFDQFWYLRNTIKDANGVVQTWEEALRYAARSRTHWLVHYGPALELTKWVRGAHLGGH